MIDTRAATPTNSTSAAISIIQFRCKAKNLDLQIMITAGTIDERCIANVCDLDKHDDRLACYIFSLVGANRDGNLGGGDMDEKN